MILGCPPKPNQPWKNEDFPLRKFQRMPHTLGATPKWFLRYFKKRQDCHFQKRWRKRDQMYLAPETTKNTDKYIFKTLNIRQAGTVTPEKWWTSKVSHTVARASLLPRWFPGHGSGKGNSGGTQRPLLFEKIELRFWEAKTAGVCSVQYRRGKSCAEKVSCRGPLEYSAEY